VQKKGRRKKKKSDHLVRSTVEGSNLSATSRKGVMTFNGKERISFKTNRRAQLEKHGKKERMPKTSRAAKG